MRGDARILQSKLDAGGFKGFEIRSIVKETGVDDEGLNEFATEYFPHPTYKDQSLTFYNALGSGKMTIGFNPFAAIQFFMKYMKRIKEDGVESHNTKGEGFLQGGWIIFNKDGIPETAFQENAKQRIPIDDIMNEIQSMQSKTEEQTASDQQKE